MLKTKYYAAIEAANAASSNKERDLEFDFSALGGGGLGSKLAGSHFFHAFLRGFWPVGRVGRFGWVVRYDDVKYVRGNDEVFESPYGLEMKELTGGKNFLLGMARDDENYTRQKEHIVAALKPADIEEIIKPCAKELAEGLVDIAGGEIDAVHDLLTRVVTETCAKYFGLKLNDPDAFAQWLMAISALLFADYFGNKATRQLALAGAQRVGTILDQSIKEARSYLKDCENLKNCEITLVRRLVAQQKADPEKGPTDDELRAILMGLAVGYVPTCAAAGGHILDVLMSKPKAMQLAVAAAKDDNDEALEKCLMEAMRFLPPIVPGLPRYTLKDTEIRGKRIPEGTTILVASMSAMFDPKRIESPKMFKTERDQTLDLNFGGAFLHQCIGEPIARALITQTFKPLLRQKNLQRAAGRPGKLKKVGPFPQNLNITFEPDIGHRNQSMVTICIPIDATVAVVEVNEKIAILGNPAKQSGIQERLDETQRVHFAHITAISADNYHASRKDEPSYLLIEMNVDGPPESAIDVFVDAAGDLLMPVFKLACHVDDNAELKRLLRSNMKKLSPCPWSARSDAASGVEFNGTPELSVPRIDKDCQIATAAREHLDEYLVRYARFGSLAVPALQYVREEIRNKFGPSALVRPSLQTLAVTRRADLETLEALKSLCRDRGFMYKVLAVVGSAWFLHLLLMRGYAGLGSVAIAGIIVNVILSLLSGAATVTMVAVVASMVKHRAARGRITMFRKTLAQNSLKFAVLSIVAGLAYLVLFRDAIGYAAWADWSVWERSKAVTTVGWELFASLVFAMILLVALIAAAGAYLAWLLRRSEKMEPAEDFEPPFQHVNGLMEQENAEGYAQNHLIAVTPLKTNPRWLRQLTLALAFWGIEKLVQHRFRPGFVLDIGTIHFARWFRLPKTDKLIFLTNYDGSWESYLEDFVTKAHLGQTAVWSNGIGFPKTRFLIFGGATDGARFKRWVRRQQVQTKFWYSRYPQLTTDQIRNNALICEGLEKARTDSDARAWIDLFNSRPRPEETIETDEIQTIVFSGMRRLLAGELVGIQFPENIENCRKWLNEVSFTPETKSRFDALVAFEEYVKNKDLSVLMANLGPASSDVVASEYISLEDIISNIASGDLKPEDFPFSDLHPEDRSETTILKVADSYKPTRLSFGDVLLEDKAMFLALSAEGLRKFHMQDWKFDQSGMKNNTLDSFPAAFLDGMSSEVRSRILNDVGESAPANWSWGGENGGDKNIPHAILLFYAETPDKLEAQVEGEIEKLKKFQFEIGHRIRMKNLPPVGQSIQEPFGFRDGISQPIIRGTRRFHKGVNPIHLVEPGEFVLGYPDNSGHFPPTPVVAAECDPNHILFGIPDNLPDRFPAFSTDAAFAPRDFGRNGTFLIVRQLEQKTCEFQEYLDTQAKKLNDMYKGLDITSAGVGAKMVGRWKDGSSIVRNPHGIKMAVGEKPDNDFLFGVDDPQGLRCPYGAHIRRANPRDSLNPGSQKQLDISNRHRNLRCGRPYGETKEGEEYEGLLFMCLNADIEREFEHTMNTYILSPTFHGLRNEVDQFAVPPIAAPGEKRQEDRPMQDFTIPTASGPLILKGLESFVTVRGGGYFFLPSRSALRFLGDGVKDEGKRWH